MEIKKHRKTMENYKKNKVNLNSFTILGDRQLNISKFLSKIMSKWLLLIEYIYFFNRKNSVKGSLRSINFLPIYNKVHQ